MCLQNTVIYSPRWNWDGDRIVPETIVPSGRPVVGGRKQYLADVREYLASGQNAVLRRTISRDVQKLVRRLHGKQGDRYWELFRSSEPGSFDFRARMVRAFVSEHIAYGKLDRSNPWQFPEETLVLRSGLCEDRAFLLAGLMLAAGISSFNVRVALGQIEFTSAGKVTAHDHMWVMYKDESGQWLLLEPLLQTKHGRPPATRPWNRSLEARYRPRFLFNDCHLWQVAADTQSLNALHPLARRWSRLHPRFAGDVHQSILNDALHDFLQQHQRPDILQDLNAHYFSPAFGVVGPTVDQFDRGTYNPFQHFDNGYIDQGWAFVKDRLAEFKSDPQKNLQSFASAAHAVADFYAHSSYLHFAKIDPQTQSAAPYSPRRRLPNRAGLHPGSFRPDLGQVHRQLEVLGQPQRSRDPPIRRVPDANQRIISGRYAQPGSGLFGSLTGDLGPGGLTHQVPEITSTIPANLKNRPCFRFRGALPHHNEIAVDEFPKKMAKADYKIQKLYDPPTYARQFTYRYNTARTHILKVFSENWSP